MYHQIHNTMFILKIRNSDITIIASNESKKLKINCNKFERTNTVLGVYRFKNSENCTINNQTFDNIKRYSRELIFENINLKIKEYQISNKTIELEQIIFEVIRIPSSRITFLLLLHMLSHLFPYLLRH